MGGSLLSPLFDLQENKQPLLGLSAGSSGRSAIADRYCDILESSWRCPAFALLFGSREKSVPWLLLCKKISLPVEAGGENLARGNRDCNSVVEQFLIISKLIN